MRLLLKFNLIFFALLAVGIALSGVVAWRLLQENAREETVSNARLLLENALSVRAYTDKQLAPLLQTQMKYTFLPQSVPAYGATEVIGELRKNYPEFSYKEATLNPTNPRDRAVDWEADLIAQFRNRAETTEIVGERDTPIGRALFIARPLKLTNASCLRCHSTPDAAPTPMIDQYGPNNGFGWKLNDILTAQIVSVPMAIPFQRAERTFTVFITSLVAVLLGIGVVLNLTLWLMFIRPVVRLSKLADRVSMGEFDAPEFKARARDEIGTLAQSLSRMRASLVQAMKMLDS